MAYHVGQIVRYRTPLLGEESLTFIVLELNRNRILIQSRDFPDWRIAPCETVEIGEIIATEEAQG